MDKHLVSEVGDALDNFGIATQRRGTEPTEEYETDFEENFESIQLNQKIEFITPKELAAVLNHTVDGVIELRADKQEVVYSTHFGEVAFLSDSTVWDEDNPIESILMIARFKDISINDNKQLNKLNCEYTCGAATCSDGKLEFTRSLILKGGRQTENVLWECIEHYQQADRLFRDITIFN